MTADSSDVSTAWEVRATDFHARCIDVALSLLDLQRHLIALPSASDPDIKTHWPAGSLPLAFILLSDNDTEKQQQGAHIVAAVLDSQETDPLHPHCGNFTWLADDPEVGDLNAIQFVLRWLIPILVAYNDRLSIDLQQRARNTIRLALHEQERMQVAPIFSNIHIASLFTLLVGAEWLKDDHFLQLSKNRWDNWVKFTVRNGAPHEYNSPNYLGWQLSALALIHQYVNDPSIKLQAGLLYERFWLHLALHVHRPTGQIAGPHSRCYWGTMTTGRGLPRDMIWHETGWDWTQTVGPYGGDPEPPVSFVNISMGLVKQHFPDYLHAWFNNQDVVLPYDVRETANRDEGYDLTTYHTRAYALGTASKTYEIGTDCFYIEHEANYLMLHYKRPDDSGGWGMMYSRYVVNDRHWGTMGPAPDRPQTGNFYDHGHFAGVQQENKAIGIYALMPEQEEVFSLKTVIAFQSGDDVDHIWINDQTVDLSQHSPSLNADDWLIVEDGEVYIGVRPLEPSKLNPAAPIRLERGPLDELWLCIYNYEGAATRFWDYASLKGAFWRGNLRAGFIVEVAERHEYESATAFLSHLQTAQIADVVDDDSIRTVSYSSGQDTLTLRYDLWNTEPVERFISGRLYRSPNLSSPLAVQGDTGYLKLGNAHLHTNPQPVWLIAQELDPESRTYIAVNPTEQITPVHLKTPSGVIIAEAWGMGRIEWKCPEFGEQKIIISGLELPKGLSTPEGVSVVLQHSLFDV